MNISNNFLQSKKWAKFWLKTNSILDKNHQVIEIKTILEKSYKNGLIKPDKELLYFNLVEYYKKKQEFIYQYPFLFQSVFWYIPRLKSTKNIDEIAYLIYLIAKIAKSKNIIFLKWDLDNFNLIEESKMTNLEVTNFYYNLFKDKISDYKVNLSQKIQWRETYFLNLVDIYNEPKTNLNDLTILDLTSFYKKNLDFWKKRNKNIQRYTKKSLKYNWNFSYQKTKENIEIAFNLLKNTANRQKFYLHPRKYYQDLLQEDFSYLIILKDSQNKPVACWVGVFWDFTLVYLYGANEEIGLKNYSQYFLHLLAIYLGFSLQANFYDLGGSDEGKGYAKFKANYHGQKIMYSGPYQITFNYYYFYLKTIFKKIKKILHLS